MTIVKRLSFIGLLAWGMVLAGCAPEAFMIMTAEDCFEDETFVPEDEFCYLTCELEGTCAEEQGLLEFFSGFLAGLGDIVFGPPEDVNVLITYDLENDQPVNPREGEPFSATEDDILADSESHQEMWSEFSMLIPEDKRRDITQFGIFTDGEENTMAYVEPNPDNPLTWKIVMDAIDAENKKEQQYHDS